MRFSLLMLAACSTLATPACQAPTAKPEPAPAQTAQQAAPAPSTQATTKHYGTAFTLELAQPVSKAVAEVGRAPKVADGDAAAAAACGEGPTAGGDKSVGDKKADAAKNDEATSCAEFTKPSGKTVRVSGSVKSVCQKAGCWLVLEEGNKEIRIFTKNHGFFLPKDIAGRLAEVEGTLREKKISRKFAEHLAKDEGKDPKTAKLPSREYIMTATGVKLL